MAVIATGFFDGVHLGHRSVVRQLVAAARERGTDSVVVTFRPHPRAVLQQDAPQLRLLTSFSEKRALLRALGIDRLEVIPFTREFASLTAEQYIRDWLVGRFGCTAMVFGYDNRVGSDGADATAVSAIASSLGVELIPCTALGDISSTKIRELYLQVTWRPPRRCSATTISSMEWWSQATASAALSASRQRTCSSTSL